MNGLKKEYKKLYKSYIQILKKQRQNCLTKNEPMIEPFITQLRMLRDYQILKQPYSPVLNSDHMELISLVTAIQEYEASQAVFYKYYTQRDNIVQRISQEESEDEVLAKYIKEKAFHWDTFWNIVRLSVESWGTRC